MKRSDQDHGDSEKSPMALRVEKLAGVEITGKEVASAKGLKFREPALASYAYDVVPRRGNHDFIDACRTLANDLALVDSKDRLNFECELSESGGKYQLVFTRPPKNFKRPELNVALECVETKRHLLPYLNITRMRSDDKDFVFNVTGDVPLGEVCGNTGLDRKSVV